MSELLLGCGHRRDKLIWPAGSPRGWEALTTLDRNPACGPDVVHDLNQLPLPFGARQFREVHAYHVLEHFGRQGDAGAFLAFFAEVWRILVAGGHFCALVPEVGSRWSWGDPGHTRLISEETLTFLSQSAYQQQAGRSPMTDYRDQYQADFRLTWTRHDGQHFWFVLQARAAAG
jgi:hypothetical protein